MRVHRAIVVAVAAMLLAACNGPGADGPAEEPTEDELGVEDPDDPVAPDAEDAEPDADGNFRGQGVIVPVPDDWAVDPAALQSGVVIVTPPDAAAFPAVVAAAGVENNPFLGFQGMDYDAVLEVLRGLDPAEGAAVDEEVELHDADRAHLLVFEAVESPEAELDEEPAVPDSDQLILLADSTEHGVAIFNYSAAAGDYDDQIEQLLLAEAGFDENSRPTLPTPG